MGKDIEKSLYSLIFKGNIEKSIKVNYKDIEYLIYPKFVKISYYDYEWFSTSFEGEHGSERSNEIIVKSLMSEITVKGKLKDEIILYFDIKLDNDYETKRLLYN